MRITSAGIQSENWLAHFMHAKIEKNRDRSWQAECQSSLYRIHVVMTDIGAIDNSLPSLR